MENGYVYIYIYIYFDSIPTFFYNVLINLILIVLLNFHVSSKLTN